MPKNFSLVSDDKVLSTEQKCSSSQPEKEKSAGSDHLAECDLSDQFSVASKSGCWTDESFWLSGEREEEGLAVAPLVVTTSSSAVVTAVNGGEEVESEQTEAEVS